jgi:drug/metabolite transporter (DMT)-like permease
MTDTALAIALALVSALGFGGGFALTQFGLRSMPPWRGAALSVPTSTLLFWCLAPLSIDLTKADAGAVAVFAAVGMLFPATVTLLSFESNRLMGPNVAGAVNALGPVFAVLLAVLLLGENLRAPQLLGLAAIVAGVSLMFWPTGRISSAPPLWTLILPLAAAAIRGGVQPIIKLGFERWPSPFAAVVVGYTISSVLLVLNAVVRDRTFPFRFDRRGALWFAAVGLCNGLGVLSMYAALERAPVALVSPLVASYPLITVVFSRIWLKHEHISKQLFSAVVITVGGIVLMIVA